MKNFYFKPVIVTPMKIRNKTRYIILEFGTLKLLEDAQGHGFTTETKANNYAFAHGWNPVKESICHTSEALF